MNLFRKKISSMLRLSLGVLLLLVGRSVRADEPQFWFFAVTELNPDPVRLELLVHDRQEDGLREFGLLLVQPRLSTQCGEFFRCGVNYAYQVRRFWNVDGKDAQYEHNNRFEAELNPGFGIVEGVNYNGRNRVEYFTDTNLDYVRTRLRHRSLIELPHLFSDKFGIVSGGEIFYNAESGRFDQYRLALPGVRVDIGSKRRVSLIPWITFVERDMTEWHSTFVVWLDVLSELHGD